MSAEEETKIVASIGNVMASATATTEARVRRNLAVQHLLSATRFSREVGRIEIENAGQPFGPFFEEIVSYCMATSLSAASALEAYANELFADGLGIFPGVSADIVNQMWELGERESTLKKFDLLLTLLHKGSMDQGTSSYQNAALLIRLRNALVHFKPEWTGTNANHAKLSAQLESVLKPGSPYFNGEEMFPTRWMTHRRARWVVESALKFLREFESKAELPAKWDYSSLKF